MWEVFKTASAWTVIILVALFVIGHIASLIDEEIVQRKYKKK